MYIYIYFPVIDLEHPPIVDLENLGARCLEPGAPGRLQATKCFKCGPCGCAMAVMFFCWAKKRWGWVEWCQVSNHKRLGYEILRRYNWWFFIETGETGEDITDDFIFSSKNHPILWFPNDEHGEPCPAMSVFTIPCWSAQKGRRSVLSACLGRIYGCRNSEMFVEVDKDSEKRSFPSGKLT